MATLPHGFQSNVEMVRAKLSEAIETGVPLNAALHQAKFEALISALPIADVEAVHVIHWKLPDGSVGHIRRVTYGTASSSFVSLMSALTPGTELSMWDGNGYVAGCIIQGS